MSQLAVSNKQEFETMTQRLKAILAILDHYQQLGLQDVLEDQLEELSKSVNWSRSLRLGIYVKHRNVCSYTGQIKRLQNQSMLRRIAEGAKNSQMILQIFRDISVLLGTFQVCTCANCERCLFICLL